MNHTSKFGYRTSFAGVVANLDAPKSVKTDAAWSEWIERIVLRLKKEAPPAKIRYPIFKEHRWYSDYDCQGAKLFIACPKKHAPTVIRVMKRYNLFRDRGEQVYYNGLLS